MRRGRRESSSRQACDDSLPVAVRWPSAKALAAQPKLGISTRTAAPGPRAPRFPAAVGFLRPSQRRHAALLWGDAWVSPWRGAPFPASPDSEVPSAGGAPTERAQLRRGHRHRHSNATLSPPLRSGGQEAWGWRPPADAPACTSASPVLRRNKAPAKWLNSLGRRREEGTSS